MPIPTRYMSWININGVGDSSDGTPRICNMIWKSCCVHLFTILHPPATMSYNYHQTQPVWPNLVLKSVLRTMFLSFKCCWLNKHWINECWIKAERLKLKCVLWTWTEVSAHVRYVLVVSPTSYCSVPEVTPILKNGFWRLWKARWNGRCGQDVARNLLSFCP